MGGGGGGAEAVGGSATSGGSAAGGVGGGIGGAAGAGADQAGEGGGSDAVAPCAQPDDCGNTDQAHCECFDMGDGSCGLRAKDADHDTYRDAECAAAPGDDCDDTHATVHPGAEEICDGLDNDCNGGADLDDGLPLAGVTTSIVEDAEQPRIAWLDAAGSFGLVWHDGYHSSSEQHVWFQRLSSGDALIGSPLRVSPSFANAGDIDRYIPLDMAAGDSEFAVLYRQESAPNAGTYFQRVSANGGLLGARRLATSDQAASGALEQVPGGDWFVFWVDAAQRVQGAQISAAGVITATAPVGHDSGTQWGVQAAQSSDEVAMAYFDGAVYWSRFASGLSTPQDVQFVSAAEPVAALVLGADASGYGVVASFNAAGAYVPRFWELSHDSQVRCGPIDLPAPSGEVVMTGIAPVNGGWLISAYERQYQALVYPLVQRVGADCGASTSPMRLTESTQSSVYGPYVAANADGLVTVWSGAPGDGTCGVYSRVFGLHLCDEPQ